MATKTADEETRQLAAYGMIALQLARKHSESGWLLYNCQCQQHIAACTTLPWNDLNPSLMASKVLASPVRAQDDPAQTA